MVYPLIDNFEQKKFTVSFFLYHNLIEIKISCVYKENLHLLFTANCASECKHEIFFIGITL